MLRPIPLIGGRGSESLPDFDAQLTENLYVEAGEPGSKAPAALVSRAGSSVYSTQVAGNRVAAMQTSDRGDVTVAVIEASPPVVRMYIDAAPPFTAGTLAPFLDQTGRQKVGLATDPSGDRWAITTDSAVMQFLISQLGAWTVIPTSYQARDVAHLDNRFVFLDGAGNIRHTDLNSVGIQEPNFEPPGVHAVALGTIGRELWVFGTNGVEVWYNVGGAGFVYARQDGATIDVGLHSANAVARMDGTLYFVSKDEDNRIRVVRVNGYSVEPVSTPLVDRHINERHEKANHSCDAFSYSYSGHGFLVLRFRSEQPSLTPDFSLALDTGTGHWFSISNQETNNVATAYNVVSSARRGNRMLIGSATNGEVRSVETTLHADNGMPFTKRRRLGRVVSATAARHSQFELRARTGDANASEPSVMLRWSDDGGRTFGEEHVASLGEQGEYVKRAAFRRLGVSRDRVYELAISDSVPVVLLETLADIVATRT